MRLQAAGCKMPKSGENLVVNSWCLLCLVLFSFASQNKENSLSLQVSVTAKQAAGAVTYSILQSRRSYKSRLSRGTSPLSRAMS